MEKQEPEFEHSQNSIRASQTKEAFDERIPGYCYSRGEATTNDLSTATHRIGQAPSPLYLSGTPRPVRRQ